MAQEIPEDMQGILMEMQQQVMGVPVSPVPTVVRIAQVPNSEGGMFVAMEFATPLGTQTYFFEPHAARKLGMELQKVGSAGNLILSGKGGVA